MTTIRHIPHDSTVIPELFLDQFILTSADLGEEVLRMTDHHTCALFGAGPESDLVFPVSRLLVDVERFEDDSQESMTARGMGVLYSCTHDLKPLRRDLRTDEREELLSRYYRPHHAALQRGVDQALEGEGRALIIDCHSFPSKRLPYEIGKDGERCEVCIGTDTFHTPADMQRVAVAGFADAGFSVAVNNPFSGAITPLKHYGKDKRVMSIMIEMRRDLYMNEETGEKGHDFERIHTLIQQVMDLLEEYCSKRCLKGLKDEYLNVRFRCERADPPPTFFIITACNPDGETKDALVNQEADQRLLLEIDQLGCIAFPVTGGNVDFSHSEPGYGLTCSRQDALRLARQFGQQAVFEVREGRVYLLSAQEPNAATEEVGAWVNLLCD